MPEGRVGPLPHRAWQSFHSAAHFVWREHFGPIARATAFLRRVAGLGAAESAALLLVVAAAALAGGSFIPAMPSRVQLTMRAVAHLSLFVAGWSAALAAAAAQPSPWLLLALAPWLAFYQLLSLNIWVGTPVVVAPTVVVLFAAHRSLRVWSSRIQAAVLWVAVSSAFAYVAAGPSGLRRWLGWTSAEAQVLVALVLTVVGWTAMAWPLPSVDARQRFRHVFVAASLVFGGAMALAAHRALAITLDWTHAMAGDLAALVVLFWMWIGGRAGVGALHLAEWLGRQTVRVVPANARVSFLALTIAVVSVLECVRWRQSDGDFSTLTLLWHAAIGAIVAVVLAWVRVRRRADERIAVDLTVWWAVAWWLLEGTSRAVQAIVTSRSGPGLSSVSVGALATGLVLEFGALERSWAAMPDARVRRQLGLLVASLACAVMLATTADANWAGTRNLMLLTGLLHIALPVAIATRWQHRRGEAPLAEMTRVLLFAGGYAGGLGVLLIDPRRDVGLLVLVPVLVGALTFVHWRAPALGPAAGVMAGVLFAAGAVAAWMMPYPPTIPFSSLRPWMNVLTAWGQIGRPLLTGRHLAVLVTAWGIGGAFGAAIFGRRAQRHPRDVMAA